MSHWLEVICFVFDAFVRYSILAVLLGIVILAIKLCFCCVAVLSLVGAVLLMLLMHYQNITITFRLSPTQNKQYNCSMIPQLNGSMEMEFYVDSLNTIEQTFKKQLQDHVPHGATGCNDTYRVAIVVPYRNRPYLFAFLNHIHRLMGRQRQQYGIFVVEPLANETFNRGKLLNIGYTEALKIYPSWDCFIFHDVDVFAESDHNRYWCGADDQPRGLCSSRNTTAQRNETVFGKPYPQFMGAACAVPTDTVRFVNGHSNDFWGHGAEDDDFSNRLTINGYRIEHTPPTDGHMVMVQHGKMGTEKGNLKNLCGLNMARQAKRRYQTDGLNTLKYNLLRVIERPSYIHFFVDTFEKESKESFIEREPIFAHCYK